MMNLKETINFKTLREKGPSAVEVKGDVCKLIELNPGIARKHYLKFDPEL